MPRPPGIIDRVNYVVHFIEDPCEAPWTVYVETALEAAGEVFMGYATPSPQDVLRFYIKPRSARSQGKFLRDVEESGEEERSLGLLPDVNELLGTLLPFSTELAESAVHTRIAWFWVLDGVLERLLWYWFLAEMASEFLFDWTTALNKSEYCSVDRGGSALIQADTIFVHFGNTWLAVLPTVVRKSWGAVIGSENGSITFTTVGGTVVAGLAVTPDGNITTVDVGLFRNDEAEPQHVTHMDFTENPTTAQTALMRATAKPGDIWSMNVKYQIGGPDGLGLFLTNVNLSGFGESTQGGTPESM